MSDAAEINIYRAIHSDTGQTHYFAGTFNSESRKYIPPPPTDKKHVFGHQGRVGSFDTFADAMKYKGYYKYSVADQAARGNKAWNETRISPEGWSENLGEGYTPWISQKRGRRRKSRRE